MNGLAVRDVEFNGTILKAAQDINNIIWVGVRWICDGIGLSRGQINRQVANIQSDRLLSRGCTKFDAGAFDENNQSLALQLDYLPAWLFKIKITPKMERENPELANNLEKYQLKAKDVLAEAFLGKKDEVVSRSSQNTIQLQLPNVPDYTEQFEEINHKFEKMYKDMGKLASIILSSKNQPTIIENKTVVTDFAYDWKKMMYSKMDKLLDGDKFQNKAEVMKYIYRYMNKNYGIVWDQEIKEHMNRNESVNKPSIIDVVYEDETYRSIFDSILCDLVENNKLDSDISIKNTDKIIRPLINKYCDTSNAGMATYKVVYAYMDRNYKINWKNRETRYINQFGAKTLSKKNIINASASLIKIFESAVKVLLTE